MTIDEQIEFIKKGAVDLPREEDLKAKFEKNAKTGNPPLVELRRGQAKIFKGESRLDNSKSQI